MKTHQRQKRFRRFNGFRVVKENAHRSKLLCIYIKPSASKGTLVIFFFYFSMLASVANMQLDVSVGCMLDWQMGNQGLFPRGRDELTPV